VGSVDCSGGGLQAVKGKDVVECTQRHELLLVTQDQKPQELAELRSIKYFLISNAMMAKIEDEKIRGNYKNVAE
jgi:hypothetical protein